MYNILKLKIIKIWLISRTLWIELFKTRIQLNYYLTKSKYFTNWIVVTYWHLDWFTPLVSTLLFIITISIGYMDDCEVHIPHTNYYFILIFIKKRINYSKSTGSYSRILNKQIFINLSCMNVRSRSNNCSWLAVFFTICNICPLKTWKNGAVMFDIYLNTNHVISFNQ